MGSMQQPYAGDTEVRYDDLFALYEQMAERLPELWEAQRYSGCRFLGAILKRVERISGSHHRRSGVEVSRNRR
jgi:hypothetical protein